MTTLYLARHGRAQSEAIAPCLHGERSGHGSPRWRDGFVM
jgi:hypothetical protein